MIFILQHFWMWILGALLIGVATGFLTRDQEYDGGMSPWLSVMLGGLVVGVLAAALQALPERAGVWLETALPVCAAFLLGAAVGALVRGGALREHKLWLIGLFPAGLLWIGANMLGMAGLESAIGDAVTETTKQAGASAPFKVFGRDIALAKDVANRDALAASIDAARGVRLVTELVEGGADETRAATEKLADAGEKVAEKTADMGEKAAQGMEKAAEGAEKATEDASKTVADAAANTVTEVKQAVAIPTAADRAAAAREKLAALPETGALDAAACESALNATVTVEKIQFASSRADIERASKPLLDRIAGLLKRCPDAKAEIGGYTDDTGSERGNLKLSQRRALAVAAYLKKAGVPARRLTAVGHGPDDPIATNETDEGRAENRRIEFRVK